MGIGGKGQETQGVSLHTQGWGDEDLSLSLSLSLSKFLSLSLYLSISKFLSPPLSHAVLLSYSLESRSPPIPPLEQSMRACGLLPHPDACAQLPHLNALMGPLP